MNKALRVQNIDLLFLLRFSIRDLERQLKQHKCVSCLHLYQGQLMSIDKLKVLKDSIGQLIPINTFLSTTIKLQVALALLTTSTHLDGIERVLFEIVTDGRLENVKPFANVKLLSYFPQEERSNERTCIIQMTLCIGNGPDLKYVFEQMKAKHSNSNVDESLLSLSLILFEIEKHFIADHSYLNILYNSFADTYRSFQNYEEALKHVTASLTIFEKSLPSEHYSIVSTFKIIGHVYDENQALIISLDQYCKAANIAI
ncbi:unnamed protein product [Rotaria socialis]|uniref:Uncharacterized protein n=1 Tax=Rotaria socialis TaxID=392032 RepID=A0A820XSD9_9BILA|nr:unnamed protein product [Rotaria socialis]